MAIKIGGNNVFDDNRRTTIDTVTVNSYTKSQLASLSGSAAGDIVYGSDVDGGRLVAWTGSEWNYATATPYAITPPGGSPTTYDALTQSFETFTSGTYAMVVGPADFTTTIHAVGAGGGRGFGNPTLGSSKGGGKGVDSVISGPDITTITAKGGGGGAGNPVVAGGGSGYGSGGGGEGAYSPAPLRAAAAGGSYPGPTQQGFPGGTGSTTSNGSGVRHGGGGGGAGAAGIPGSDAEPGITEGDGGLGLQVLIAGNAPGAAIGTPGPSGTGWVAQGGHSGAYNNGSNGTIAQPAGGGGGNGGAHATTAGNGLSGTGGGGGGANSPGASNGIAGKGGSGIVVVRYQIASITAVAKATGGAISFFGNKTIHAFTSSGAFIANESLTAEVVVLAGGGGGGAYRAAGGGAGGLAMAPSVPFAAAPYSVVVGGGGVGGSGVNRIIAGSAGIDSTIVTGAPYTITAKGGGAGGGNLAGSTGGSGGGAQASPGPNTTGYSATQSSANPSSPFTIQNYGHAGGNGGAYPPKAGSGGGGGAGGAGEAGSPTVGGNGGLGQQLPSTFQDPGSRSGPNGGGLGAPGPGSTFHWVAGGGAGGNIFTPVTASHGGAGPSGTATYAGAGGPAGPGASPGVPGWANTGGGGAGDCIAGDGGSDTGGNGGSGLVLIAYPS